jgi:four helix bundle protein
VTEGRRDGGTEGRRDGGTEGRRDGGTEGRRDGEGTTCVAGVRRFAVGPLTYGMLAHEKLRVWAVGHELTLCVYRVTERWPKHELYGLTSQLRRAAAAVPTNLAEGSAKRGTREYRRYVDISLGSISEVAYLLQLTRDLGLLDPSDYETLDQLRRQTGAMAWRLARALDRAHP